MSVSDPDPPESFRIAAEECVDYWDDYPLDFTPESLRHLDSLVDTHWADAAEEATEGGLVGAAQQFGSYFGETLVRSHDGEWQRGDLQWSVGLAGPAGEATVNVFAVASRALAEQAAFHDTYRRVGDELEL